MDNSKLYTRSPYKTPTQQSSASTDNLLPADTKCQVPSPDGRDERVLKEVSFIANGLSRFANFEAGYKRV